MVPAITFDEYRRIAVILIGKWRSWLEESGQEGQLMQDSEAEREHMIQLVRAGLRQAVKSVVS